MNGKAAKKLLEDMRNSPSGWGQNDLERLLTGFGFKEKGKKHAIYIHPDFPDLRISVPRHNTLKEWVARDAVKAIDQLIVRKDETNAEDKKRKNA
jgi:hypothetical protein